MLPSCSRPKLLGKLSGFTCLASVSSCALSGCCCCCLRCFHCFACLFCFFALLFFSCAVASLVLSLCVFCFSRVCFCRFSGRVVACNTFRTAAEASGGIEAACRKTLFDKSTACFRPFCRFSRPCETFAVHANLLGTPRFHGGNSVRDVDRVQSHRPGYRLHGAAASGNGLCRVPPGKRAAIEHVRSAHPPSPCQLDLASSIDLVACQLSGVKPCFKGGRGVCLA